MPVSRVRAVWSGWSGGPGVSTFHFFDIRGNETATLAKVYNFIGDLYGTVGSLLWLPPIVKIDVSPVVETFDENTGELLGTTVGTKPATLTGGGTTAFAAPAGICVSWATGVVHQVPGADNPRLIRGRTFFVPTTASLYDNDGTIPSTPLSDMQAAVNAFRVAAPDFAIWSRPVAGAGGAIGQVVAGIVRDKVAMLTSRRD
jgi:hypothetical protein